MYYNTTGIRKVYGLTQKQFAEELGIPYATVRNWDGRKCMPEYVWEMAWRALRYNRMVDDLFRDGGVALPRSGGAEPATRSVD